MHGVYQFPQFPPAKVAYLFIVNQNTMLDPPTMYPQGFERRYEAVFPT